LHEKLRKLSLLSSKQAACREFNRTVD